MYYLARLDSCYLPYGIKHSTNGTFYSYSFTALFATYEDHLANYYQYISKKIHCSICQIYFTSLCHPFIHFVRVQKVITFWAFFPKLCGKSRTIRVCNFLENIIWENCQVIDYEATSEIVLVSNKFLNWTQVELSLEGIQPNSSFFESSMDWF